MVKRLLPYLFPLIAAILLVVLESDMLYALQEQNLFLHSTLFFEQQMVKAGGLLTWVGCYLTQFFYYPMLGAGILCLLWAFFMWLCQRAFRLENLWLTLIPTASLLLTIVTLGYWIYYLKLPGHAFCATIGSIVVLALVWGYRVMPRRYHLSSFYIIFAAGLGYMVFGFYALLATALMGITSWRDKKSFGGDFFLALILIILWPIFGYFIVFHETNIVNIYWVALPVFAHQGERFFVYNLPYIVLFASMVVMALKPTIKSARWLNIGIVVVTVIGLSLFWNRDENLHRELSMTRSIEKGQWAEVLETAKNVKGEPTRLICMMRHTYRPHGRQVALSAIWHSQLLLSLVHGGWRGIWLDGRASETYGDVFYLEQRACGSPAFCEPIEEDRLPQIVGKTHGDFHSRPASGSPCHRVPTYFTFAARR